MRVEPLRGIAVSEGLVSGIAKVVSFDSRAISPGLCDDPVAELARFESAKDVAAQQIHQILNSETSRLGPNEKKIFEAHLMMIEDPEYIDQIRAKISADCFEATHAVDSVSKSFAAVFAALPDPYLSERSHDILDIGARICRILTGAAVGYGNFTSSQVVLVCRDIPPSAVAELDPDHVKAVITKEGGATSHAAILLKNLEIPAIFGVKELDLEGINDRQILVDALTGTIILEPSDSEKIWFQDKVSLLEAQGRELAKLRLEPGLTLDGLRVQLLANVGRPKEIDVLDKFNPDGVGLFRTEFLFLDRKAAPGETEQTDIYRSMLGAMQGRKTIIRTLDIGGDKDVPYLNLPKEDNPFLGLRGLRYCLHNEDVFRVQLRALLRASTAGNLHIMYPMVTTVDELDRANHILFEERSNLQTAGVAIADVKVGIMIEVPAAALMADAFAAKVDFMSLGTNDLTQYTTACDRLNPSVKALYNSCEPAVLRLIQIVAKAAQKAEIDLSICGEMAGQPILTPFFIGVGIYNLSMSPPLIPRVKQRVNGIASGDCARVAQQALACSSAAQVADLLSSWLPDSNLDS